MTFIVDGDQDVLVSDDDVVDGRAQGGALAALEGRRVGRRHSASPKQEVGLHTYCAKEDRRHRPAPVQQSSGPRLLWSEPATRAS